jgi:hypothetical protein
MLFELIWQYRFLYRDLNDLLSKNRKLETHFQFVLAQQAPGHPGGARRPEDCAAALKIEPREASNAGGQRDGGGADLLAELRVRARPAPRAGARVAPARR